MAYRKTRRSREQIARMQEGKARARHTAATWLAQRLHVLELCRVFGWTNTTRAMTYFNPTDSDIAKRITAIQTQ